MFEGENKKKSQEGTGKGMDSFYSLCKETFFPPLDLSKYEIPEELLRFVPERVALAYEVIPISRKGSVLTVAISDPYNIFAAENLSLLTQMDIAPVIAPRKQIIDAIERLYSSGEAAKKKEGEAAALTTAELISFKEKKFDLEEITKLSKEAKVVKMVNKILGDAVKSRTSDIHIEPFERNVYVRFRIDGILHKQNNIDSQFQEAVIARLKLMSSLDITQRRVPQDGRFGFRTQEKDIDVRVSVLPVDFGEKIVLRLLDRTSVKLDIERLGFSPYAYEAYKQAISKPFGMILLTGPTGSGKTTTLYCLLNRLNTIERNIITIEDPVEYNLGGVIQVPVRHEIGLDFAVILRSALRQSPDIIMVGEIRDSETVDIAMKSALTGHIVFSTLHTNDASSAITRLLNMGVEPFLISSSLNLIAAQRLVRKICPKCTIGYKQDLSSSQDIPIQYRKKDVTLYKGGGCRECTNTGYRGRVAVVEALTLDDKLKDMIMARASTEDIKEYGKTHGGMKTLRDDALEKCLGSETTLEEALRVTSEF